MYGNLEMKLYLYILACVLSAHLTDTKLIHYYIPIKTKVQSFSPYYTSNYSNLKPLYPLSSMIYKCCAFFLIRLAWCIITT